MINELKDIIKSILYSDFSTLSTVLFFTLIEFFFVITILLGVHLWT